MPTSLADPRPIWAASGNVANAAAAATLPASTNNTTYITGFTLTALGATAAGVVLVTVAGLSAGTMTFVYAVVAGATLANPNLHVTFATAQPALPASVIIVSCPALGAGNTNAAMVAWGFQA